MHRCQLYMFRTVTVHPQELLFRWCMCRLWYVVRTALSDTSRWYNVWGRTNFNLKNLTQYKVYIRPKQLNDVPFTNQSKIQNGWWKDKNLSNESSWRVLVNISRWCRYDYYTAAPVLETSTNLFCLSHQGPRRSTLQSGDKTSAVL